MARKKLLTKTIKVASTKDADGKFLKYLIFF